MQVTIKPTTYIYLVTLLLLIPLPWLGAWLMAMVFHEFCHWSAVWLCGGRVQRLSLGIGGAVMECDMLPLKQAFFCVMCGPLGGLILVLLGRWMPRTAICSCVLSVYNLLPLLPLDGGRVLRLLIKREKTFILIEKGILFILTVGALYVTLRLPLGVFPLLVVGILWLKNRNSPCKESFCRVQ